MNKNINYIITGTRKFQRKRINNIFDIIYLMLEIFAAKKKVLLTNI